MRANLYNTDKDLLPTKILTSNSYSYNNFGATFNMKMKGLVIQVLERQKNAGLMNGFA